MGVSTDVHTRTGVDAAHDIQKMVAYNSSTFDLLKMSK